MRTLLIRGAVAVALVLAVAGCRTLSERDCRAGNWTDIGRTDGARGLPASELERHRDACAGHGVTPDPAAYRAGHAEGLRQFCVPAKGYAAGRAGEAYRDVCPAAAEEEFLRAHHSGRRVHELLLEVRELRQRVDELQLAAMSGDYGPDDTTALRFRANEMESRLRRREWQLEDLDRRYAREFGASQLRRSDWRRFQP